MKKILTFLLLLASFSLFGLTDDAFASTGDSVKESLIENDQVFKKAVDLGMVNLDSNGELNYLGTSKDLNVSHELYTQFLDKIESVNYLVNLEVAEVDKEFNFILPSSEEITNIIYENDKKSKSVVRLDTDLKNSVNNQVVSPMDLDTGLPGINLTNLVETNKTTVENYLASMLKTAPKSAYTTTIAFFVGKVKEGGAWDYKSQPGYKYWYKEWLAITYSGRRTINSEYIGNYNYAYVGETLFSKSVLLIGGAGVGAGVGQPEDAKDREAISAGYDDAVKYW